jgi:phage terminase large subunit-like protein
MTELLTDDVELENEFDDLSDAEREALADTAVELDETSQEFVDKLIGKLMVVCDQISGHPLRNYQKPFARRVFESLIINDGATITALFARQTGKSETVANVIATAMIMFPILAKVFPDLLGKFAEGVWVGAFAPVDEQADTLFGRIVSRLTSDSATSVLQDPEVNGVVMAKGRSVYIRFRNMDAPLQDGKGHSLVRKTTAHPRATIEGRSYHIILIDECQGADDRVVNKSIGPMGAAYNATMVFTGTPTYTKNVFYNTIQGNKRALTKRGTVRCNHFEVDWKTAARENANYRKFVSKEMLRMGEDSDEFKLSYRLMWLLDKGMFTTSEKLDECGDITMQSVVHAWSHSPVVVGIDPARKQDKTVVTVVWVDWDHPDELGYYHHRILNWLDLEGIDWEEQYYRIVEFLSNYRVHKVGVDVGGVGDAVAQRLKLLLPGIDVVELGSSQSEQSVRWKYLRELIDRRQVVWPAGAKVRRLKMWRRFRQEMEDLELLFKGPYVLAEAPDVRDAHDDFADSLAMACVLTKDEQTTSVVEVSSNPFFTRRPRRMGR